MTIISPYAIQQFFDDNGDPLSGGKLYTYEAGTTTPKGTYTDSSGSSANTNPIILDSAGRASIWLDTGTYKFILDDSSDVNIDEVDNITGAAANVFGSSVESISTNTNITTSSQNVLYECTSSLTLSLLAVASAGEGFAFGVTNTGAGSVTIDPDGAETIDGLPTISVEAGQSLMVVCTGSDWISIFLNTINVNDQTSATIALNDELMFGDASDSYTNKKDTVQGIIDIIPDATTTVKGLVEKATSGEMDSGTADKFPDCEVVQDYHTSNTSFTDEYESSEISISDAAGDTLTHSLGAIPKLVKAVLICKTTEFGYAVDDEIDISLFGVPTLTKTQLGLALAHNSTEIKYRFANDTSPIVALNLSDGGRETLTNANWRLIIRAWV